MVELCTYWPVDQQEKDRTTNLDNSQMAAFSTSRKITSHRISILEEHNTYISI